MIGARPTMGIAECMDKFRANNLPISDKKFWGNVESGEFWFVHVCPYTKRRTATIFKTDFIEYLHSKGVKYVLPFEIEELRKDEQNEKV